MVSTVKLEIYMIDHKISQTALSRKVNVSKATMHNWMRGKTQIPLWAAMQIAKVVGQPMENLFEDDGK